jgi:hypothetical protein
MLAKTSGGSEAPFKTFVIIQFESKCDDSIKRWLESKITSGKEDNGADLLIYYSKNSKNEVRIYQKTPVNLSV